MHVQKFLRSGGTLEDLTNKFAISVSRHPKYNNLVLLKYDQIESPFAEEIVRDCRGIILDQDDNWRVVNFSMRKFFNHLEGHAAPIDWRHAKVLEKCDGSLMQLYPYNGEWHVATSGSPDAGGGVGDFGFTFQEFFWKTFAQYNNPLPPTSCHRCFFFELTSPMNKIVVSHKEPGLTLLGGRDLDNDHPDGDELQELDLEEASAFFPNIPVVKAFPLSSFEECTKSFDTFSGMSQEGYVIVNRYREADGSFNRVKHKHPQYVHLHHMKDGLQSRRSLVEVVRNGEIAEVIACLPEFESTLVEASGRFELLVAQLEEDYNKHKHIPIQKDFAIAIMNDRVKCPSALFSLRAGKTSSIRAYMKTVHIDLLMKLLDNFEKE